MAQVRRYWSERKQDLIVISVSSDYAVCFCDEFEVETVSCREAVSILRAMGLDPVFYDEFDTWDDYEDYLEGIA